MQTLLAFSSLHEQIRRRKANHNGDAAVFEEEHFVLDEVLQLVAERALAITAADGVAIALADGDSVTCRASAGRIAPDAGAQIDPKTGFSAACFRTGQIARCDDTENDPRVNLEACRRLNTRSMVAVPLCGQHSVIGLIEAFSEEAYGFNDSDIRSLILLAELLLAAMKPEEEDRLASISRELADHLRGPEQNVPNRMPSIEDVQAVLQVHRVDVLPPAREEHEPVDAPAILSGYEHKSSYTGILIVLIVVLTGLGVGGAVWWKLYSGNHAAVSQPGASGTSAPTEDGAESSPSGGQADVKVAPAEKLGDTTQVTNIRHWSSGESSTVVIDLQDQVQYEAHRLTEPERIYFDLHDTTLAPALPKTFEIGDGLLVRVRAAQLSPGIIRVVLETKGSPNFSVSLEPSPYRLVVEVRSVGATAKPRAKVDLFAPVNPETVASSSADGSSLRPDPRHARASGLRIVLDAGHGGWDLGTVGPTGLLEKDLVLDVVARLGSMLERRLGAEVIYTRQDDNYISLEKRAEIANFSQAGVFLSVHANYSDYTTARGVETYFTNTYSSVNARTRETDSSPSAIQLDWTNVDIREKVRQSRRLALSVQGELFRGLAEENPGIRNRGVKEASYVVLTGTTMPAILAEISFVSSPADERSLRNPVYRQQIAESLFRGVAGFENETRKVNIASAAGKLAGK